MSFWKCDVIRIYLIIILNDTRCDDSPVAEKWMVCVTLLEVPWKCNKRGYFDRWIPPTVSSKMCYEFSVEYRCILEPWTYNPWGYNLI